MNIDIRPILAFILVVILTILLFSCKAKETTTEGTILIDKIKTNSFNIKSEPIKTVYTFDLVCDSLGNIRNRNFENTSGNNNARLIIENNKLRAELKTGQSQIKTDTIYKTKYKDVYKNKKVVRYKVSPWHWLGHLIALIIIFLVWKYF